MHLTVVGINFHNTPVELLEKLSIRPLDVPTVLERMRSRCPPVELLLLSTCNRTELYAAGSEAQDSFAQLTELLLGQVGDCRRQLQPYLYHWQGQEALAHLMKVAASLDSMVVGETEILGQVKQAYEAAQAAGTIGGCLAPVMQRVLKVAKRVRAETAVARGRVSVGSVAVELVEMVFADLAAKTVLVVGTGEVSEQTLKHLVEKGVKEAMVLSRSTERGRALASRYGGVVVAFERLAEYLPRADIVVSSTGAPHFVIHAAAVGRAMLARDQRPMFLIDLAVPRDIEPATGELENVHLCDIDDLQKLAGENLARRQAAVAQALEIVGEEVLEAADLFRGRGERLGAVVRRIDAKSERIAESELKRAFAKQAVAPIPGTCDHCREEIRNMLHRAMSKMTADSKRALNQAARSERWDEFAELVERLFGEDADDGSDA